jgi:hypothetical protein
MAAGSQAKKADTRTPNPKSEWIFREFGGMNTQAFRTSIKDNEFSWLENAMPIGEGDIKVVPAQSASLQTFAGATSYYAMGFNVAGIDYTFVVCLDGSAYQIQETSPYTRVLIGAAGTFSAAGVWAAQWKNAGIVIVDPAKGYFDWNITAPVTLTLIDATKTNNLVAVYSARVWMASGRTVTFTDANSYNSFAGSGGSFVMSDPTLHSVINGLLTSNNFLYVVGESSVTVISDVRVVGGVAVFSTTLVESSIGTIFPMTLYSYYRAILFATSFGVYSLYGATPSKVSDELDGIWPLIDFTKPVSGGAVIVYNQLCAVFCFTYKDPLLGASRQLLALNFNKKWFVSSQGTINFVWADVINGVPVMFGTDGLNMFQLWINLAANIASEVRTKLYGFESSLMDKQAMRFGIEAVIPAVVTTINVTVDSEATANPYVLGGGNVVTWIGSGVVTWIGAGVVTWLGTGFSRYESDVDTWGKYLGATVTSTAPQLQLTCMMMEYIDHQDALWSR